MILNLIDTKDLLLLIITAILAALNCALIGNALFLQKRVMVSDCIAHSLLLGVVLVFLLIPVNIFTLALGAVVIGFLSFAVADFLENKAGLNIDTALILSSSIFLAIGVLLISVFKDILVADLNPSHFLFGNLLLSILESYRIFDLDISLKTTQLFFNLIALICYWLLMHRVIFAIGLENNNYYINKSVINAVKFSTMIMTAITAMMIFEIAGIILMLVMFSLPASISYLIAKSPVQMIIFSVLVAIIGAIFGVIIALVTNTAFSAAIALVESLIFIFVIFYKWFPSKNKKLA